MKQLQHRTLDFLAELYFGAKRLYYTLRHPGVSVAPDGRILGTLKIRRGTRVIVGPGCSLRMKVCFSGPKSMPADVVVIGNPQQVVKHFDYPRVSV